MVMAGEQKRNCRQPPITLASISHPFFKIEILGNPGLHYN
jgi:hypothetical protein